MLGVRETNNKCDLFDIAKGKTIIAHQKRAFYGLSFVSSWLRHKLIKILDLVQLMLQFEQQQNKSEK